MQKYFCLAHPTHLALRSSYWSIFPETFKLLNIIPVGIASVERSFSAMKLIKTRLCSGITDGNLGQLMRISIKGPALPAVDFSEVLNIF